VIQPESANLPRIHRLIVIAGLPCSGKSTLIAALQRGELPTLQQKLAIDDPLDWAYIQACDLPTLKGLYARKLVLHYDILAQRSPTGYRFIAGLLRNTDQAVFLTLRAESKILIARNRLRLREIVQVCIRHAAYRRQVIRRLRNILNRYLIYRNRRAVFDLYFHWFSFCMDCGNHTHWVSNAHQNEDIHALTQRDLISGSAD